MADRNVLYKLNVEGNMIPKTKELATNLKLVKTETDKVAPAATSLRKVLAGLAGDLGSTGARALNLTEGIAGLGGKLGTVATVAGAAVIGIGALAVGVTKAMRATIEFGQQAIESEKRIRGLGYVTDQQAESVRGLAAAYEGAKIATDAFNTRFAAEHAKEIEHVNDVWTDWSNTIKEVGLRFSFFLAKLGGYGKTYAKVGVPAGIERDYSPPESIALPPGGIPASTSPRAGIGTREDRAGRIASANAENGQIIVDNLQRIWDANERIYEANQQISENVVDGYQRLLDQAKEDAEAAQKARDEAAAARAGSQASVISGIAGGDATGLIGGALSGAIGGPIGMIASAVVQLGPNLGHVLRDGIRQVFELVTQLPNWLIDAVLGVVDTLEALLPRLISGILEMAPRLVIGLIAALPQIMIGITKAILGIPGQIVAGIKELPKMLLEALKQLFTGFKDDSGHFLGTSFKRGETEILGFGDRRHEGKVPKMATGGQVESDGIAYLHAGERVVPAKASRGGGGGDVHIHNYGGMVDVANLADQLRKVLGPYGRRSSLSPLPV